MRPLTPGGRPPAFPWRGNVTIRIADKLGTVVGSILGLFAELVVLGVMIIMARQFYLHAAAIARDGETTWVLRLPTAPFWFIVDAILWSAVIVQIAIVVIDGHRFVRGPRS